ncbi:MAG: S-layer homology domain-containing protein, partial [Oscillospiraceae bacterium]|nr:S-layer homology domain-containing protein [Oscillospiraceae bacterium]
MKFDTNGGSKVNSQTVKKNGLVKEPVNPVREDYIFLGWYTDSKLTKPYDFDTRVKEGMTLYAKWEKVSEDDNSSNSGFIEPAPVDPTPVNPAPVEPTPLPVNPPAQTQSSLLKGDSGISYVNGRSEGVFAPNMSITRGETAVILYRLMSDEARAAYYAASNNFNDVGDSAWYNEAISTLVQAGVLDGYGDGTFRPEQPVTRAELAAVLVRVQGGSSASGAGFTDTNEHWAEGYISSAVMSGLVLGYEDGSFRPDQGVTRAESVTMINRMLMRSAMDTSASATVTFVDVQPSDWFYGDVMAAANGYL